MSIDSQRVVLEQWGWSESREEHFQANLEASFQPGRVISQQRDRWTIQTETGPVDAIIPQGSEFPGYPTVGDWVGLQTTESTGPRLIGHILPRKSKFSRRAAGPRQDEQVVAANVDTVWIVHGLDLPPNLRRLERYLAMTWESGSQPEIILTKADIANNLKDAISGVHEIAYGVPVRVTSSVHEGGLESLEDALKPRTTIALLGPSGVGKSTLINHLGAAELLKTAEVRSGDRKGRHTTARREIIRLPGGALMLDTPGMRELQVWDLDEGLQHAFPEIQELATRCRFRDCTHTTEPECAVLTSVQNGDLSAARLGSFQKLRKESDYREKRTDPLAMAAVKREWKTIMKSIKHHPKYRDKR
ncbi:ribosome small subunit-dependent GTPase A [Candidatus Neomarinimicrobiota bacterium]